MNSNTTIRARWQKHTLDAVQVEKLLCILCNKLHQGYRKNQVKIGDVYLQRRAVSVRLEYTLKKSSGMILRDKAWNVNTGSAMLNKRQLVVGVAVRWQSVRKHKLILKTTALFNYTRVREAALFTSVIPEHFRQWCVENLWNDLRSFRGRTKTSVHVLLLKHCVSLPSLSSWDSSVFRSLICDSCSASLFKATVYFREVIVPKEHLFRTLEGPGRDGKPTLRPHRWNHTICDQSNTNWSSSHHRDRSHLTTKHFLDQPHEEN